MKLLIAVADYAYAAYLKTASHLNQMPQYKLTETENEQVVLLVPGVYENWYFFRRLQKSLVASGYKVINTEQLLNSTSVLEDGGKIAQYLDSESMTSVILVGHSSGGLTALRVLHLSERVAKVVTIAAPFHGVTNGRILRTKLVRDLLPDSTVFTELKKLPNGKLRRVTSIYPSYDNQVWSKKGSILLGAKNVKLKSRGHHLILRSKELTTYIVAELK